jgi:Protein of unknown function (DUF3558)
MRRPIVVVLCAALVSLAACGPTTVGAIAPRTTTTPPTTTSSAPPTPQLFAAHVFGDAATVDLCSTLDLGALPAALHAKVDDDGMPFDTCIVDLRLPDGTDSSVGVGPLEAGTEHVGHLVTQLSDGMALYEDTEPPQGYCGNQVAFADSYLYDVEVGPVSGSTKPCPIAEQVGRDVAAKLLAGGLTHRHYAAGSLGSVDPCGLVPTAALASAGLTGAAATEYPQHHQCDWTSDNLSIDTVNLAFQISTAPTVIDPSTDKVVSVAGRSTVRTDSRSDQTCYLDVAVGPYSGGHGLKEIAELTVTTNGDDPAMACQVATKVATTLWPKLPRP